MSPALVTVDSWASGLAFGGGEFVFHCFLTLPITPHYRCPYPLIVRPGVPYVAHSPSLYLPAPTHTSEQTFPCSHSLNPLKMAHPKGGSAASRRCRCPRGASCASSRSRHEPWTGCASLALTATSTTCKETSGLTINFFHGSFNFLKLILTLNINFYARRFPYHH